MRSIDIHAHITPESCLDAMRQGSGWHSLAAQQVARRYQGYTPRGMWGPDEGLKDMDSLGVELHILSTHSFMYFYDGDAEAVAKMDRECNDYVHQLTMDHPTRFAGLANLPMQDVRASVTELERSVTQLGLLIALLTPNFPNNT